MWDRQVELFILSVLSSRVTLKSVCVCSVCVKRGAAGPALLPCHRTGAAEGTAPPHRGWLFSLINAGCAVCGAGWWNYARCGTENVIFFFVRAHSRVFNENQLAWGVLSKSKVILNASFCSVSKYWHLGLPGVREKMWNQMAKLMNLWNYAPISTGTGEWLSKFSGNPLDWRIFSRSEVVLRLILSIFKILTHWFSWK